MSRPVIAIRTCPTCKEDFQVTSSHPSQKYCSVPCWTTTKESKAIVSKTQKEKHSHLKEEDGYLPTKKRYQKICPECDSPFEVQPSRRHQIYCGQSCSAKAKEGKRLRDSGRFL